MQYLMGIDNGGCFSKAAIFDTDGNQISVASLPTETLTPKSGYTERNLDMLWDINVQVIRSAVERSRIAPEKIAGVSFSGHGKGLYLIREDGTPAYNGILSQDTRAWEYVERWKVDGTAQKVFQKSYQSILVMQHVSLLAWFQDYHPEVLEQTKYIFSVKDYIRYKLTGEAYAEYSDFSGSNLVNMITKTYDREHLALFGLEDIYDKLPPLRYAADVAGYVTEHASKQTLLSEGTPVAAGMFDVNACGIASGLADENQMCMIAGTWSINEYIARHPITNGSVTLNSMFCIPGYYLVEESSPTSAGNLEWFINNLMSCEKKEEAGEGRSVYKLADIWVESVAPEDCNIIFLPFLNGAGSSPLAKGSFIGLTSYHNKKHMVRSVFEGVVFSHVSHVKRLMENCSKPKSIRLSGGVVNSDVWVQIFADALQIPVEVVENKEAGAQGAAMAAGIATGIYADYAEAIARAVRITRTVQPRKEYKKIYEMKYYLYCKVEETLNSVWEGFSPVAVE